MKTKYKIFLFGLFILSSFLLEKTNEKIDPSELANYFRHKSLDEMRQDIWTIYDSICKNKKNIEEVEEEIHRQNEEMGSVRDYLINFLNDKILDECESGAKINRIINIIKDNGKFTLSSLKDNSLPKNFHINFAINIDRYMRLKKGNINGINNYINYLSFEEIQKFNYQSIKDYPELSIYARNFTKIVLKKDINYDAEQSIQDYVNSKSKEEIISYIYGYENYVYNVLNKDSFTYKSIDHSILYDQSRDELLSILNRYMKEFNSQNNINTLDKFIILIENLNFKYVNCEAFMEKIKTDEDWKNDLLALEKYHKKQKGLKKSLKGLEDYIDKIPIDRKKKSLRWGLKTYPELYETGRFKDVIDNEKNFQYGEVKEFIQANERHKLLKYALNTKYFNKKNRTIYDENLYNLYRYTKNKLYNVIFENTIKNEYLQTKENFIDIADFHNGNLSVYLNSLQTQQLRVLSKTINEKNLLKFLGNPDYEHRKKEELNKIENSNDTELRKDIYSNIKKVVENSWFEIFNDENKTLTDDFNKGYPTFTYYCNIFDFLRSTNIKYLKQWLRKFEIIIDKEKEIRGVTGGVDKLFNLKNVSKKEIMAMFDKYLTYYPELFKPEKFINIVGLDKGTTPHKYIIDILEDILASNKTKDEIFNMVANIMYNFVGYFERNNLQLTFVKKLYGEELNDFLAEVVKGLMQYNNDYLYSIYRIFNIFPELNNINTFKYIIIDGHNSENFNKYEFQCSEEFSTDTIKKRGINIKEVAENIHYYLINTQGNDKEYDDKEESPHFHKDYCVKFCLKLNPQERSEILGRVMQGQFLYLFDDYEYTYLKSISKDKLEIIKNNTINYIETKGNKKEIKKGEEIEFIKETIKNNTELQDPTNFDKFIDENIDSKNSEFTKILMEQSFKDLIYFTLACSMKRVEISNNKNDYKQLFRIHITRRKEIVRYIIDFKKEIEKKKINLKVDIENLKTMVNKYKLDLGSDLIEDLTLY